VLSEGAHSHRDASVSTGAAAGHGVATVPIYSPTDDLRG
jgi:hypothetical protein